MAQSYRIGKDPDAVLDYSMDWTAWLLPGDSVSASDWLADDGITIDSDALAGPVATVWLSGGTARRTYVVTNRITTNGGRVDDRSITVYVMDR